MNKRWRRGSFKIGAENLFYCSVFNSRSSRNGFYIFYQSISCVERNFRAGGAKPRDFCDVRCLRNARSRIIIRNCFLYGRLICSVNIGNRAMRTFRVWYLICDAAVIAVRHRDRFYAPGRVIFLAFFNAKHWREFLYIERIRRYR